MDYEEDGDREDDTDLILMIYGAWLLSTERTFGSCLSLQAKRNRSGKTRRGAIKEYWQSPFAHLFNSGHNDALMTLTGFDHPSFDLLLKPFKEYFDECTPYSNGGLAKRRANSCGRPRGIDAVGCLGMFAHPLGIWRFCIAKLVQHRHCRLLN